MPSERIRGRPVRPAADQRGGPGHGERIERLGPLHHRVGTQPGDARPIEGEPRTELQPSVARRSRVEIAAATVARAWSSATPRGSIGPYVPATSAATSAIARVSATASPGSRRGGAPDDQAVPLGERQGGTQDGPPANRRSCSSSGSSKTSGWPGRAARRRRTWAIARAAELRSSISHGGIAPTRIRPAGIPSRRASAAPRSSRARARPGQRGRTRRGALGRGRGATTSGPAPRTTIEPERAIRRWAKAWSARARSGSTLPSTTSAIGSPSTMSTRSKAATTACSGPARGSAAVARRA